MQQQMTTYPMDGQLCVKVASVDLLLCVFYDTIVDHKYRNWTSWLNPKIYHWRNFSAIVYIAVRIHVMFILNIPNLQRLKVDSFMFHFMLCL